MSTARHDRHETIKKATQLFWEKGFHATSMRNLQDFVDLRPGSIYASFGSKEGLFKETLQCYANASLERLATYAETRPPLDALKAFITDTVCTKKGSSPSDMCMLAKTIAELTQDNAELLAEAKRLLKTIEAAFADLVVNAQQDGAIDASKDPIRIASFLQMQLMGLRAYSRANDGNADIKALIEDVFAGLS
jgi:TetR/AcrR family transcriptional repressor of nem operon